MIRLKLARLKIRTLSRNMSIIIPALKYPGGKFRDAKKIISYFPEHDYYLEPFGGGASVLLQKAPSKIETYNDLSSDVVNFFKVLRDTPDELINQIELTPFSKVEHKLAYEPATEPVERARRFYVRSWQSHTPRLFSISGWAARKHAENRYSINEFQRVEHLFGIAKRLRSVQIENDAAINILNKYVVHSNTLVYCDPPYINSTHSYDNAYEFNMTDDEHIELASTLNSLTCKVVVSGYNCELYQSLYGGWYNYEFESQVSRGAARTEAIWTNFESPSLPLFSQVIMG